MSDLEGALRVLTASFTSINSQFDELNELKNSLDNFNSTLSNFLSMVKLQAQTMKFPETPKVLVKQRKADSKSKIPTNLRRSARQEANTNAATVIKNLLKELPENYQAPFHRNNIEAIAKFLISKKDGAYSHEVISGASIPKVKCMEYLNSLVKNGHITKKNYKGFLYSINLEKFK